MVLHPSEVLDSGCLFGEGYALNGMIKARRRCIFCIEGGYQSMHPIEGSSNRPFGGDRTRIHERADIQGYHRKESSRVEMHGVSIKIHLISQFSPEPSCSGAGGTQTRGLAIRPCKIDLRLSGLT